MFEWNVEKGVRLFDKFYVTSDYLPVLNRAKEMGAIPILRNQPALVKGPNIEWYSYCLSFMEADAVVALQVNSPTISENLICAIRDSMNYMEEVKTSHMNGEDYGSIWALTPDRIRNYKDPYAADPEAWFYDPSVDIHTEKDLKDALLQHRVN